MTIILNPNQTKHFTVEDVRAYFAGEGIDVTTAKVEVDTDALGMINAMDVGITLTAPQIAAFEEEFFTTSVTALSTKGDILTHDDANEQRLPVGTDGQILVADSVEAFGVKWIDGGFSVIDDQTLAVQQSFRLLF